MKYKNFKVYVDSPLAIRATHIFRKNYLEYFDQETTNLIAKGINPLEFKNLKMSLTADDSKSIELEKGYKVIISASGMCEAGRIRHHLRTYLPGPKNTIVFVGYQVPGTLGRIILDGAKSVKLFNENIPINAKIVQMQGTSSHADMDDLKTWAESFNPKPARIFITHGDEETSLSFAEMLEATQQTISVPYNGAIWDLITDESIFEGNKQIKRRTDRQARKRYHVKISGVYGKLLDALELLSESVKKNEGLENRELRKFTSEIEALAQKWDRDI
jgi:metallo-beta-lactamase family protein